MEDFSFYSTLLFTLIICFVGEKVFLAFLKLFGVFTIVNENEARVYVLFGNVLGVIQEPGLHFLFPKPTQHKVRST